ncbi:family 2 encapsulin nanocompartment cargo protein terpene cyclase [Streptomyces sp. 2A115]|uniref:family 2 encapsulin nanocompartment cargo protein terpene cyclase n=1 Tax=Streptomyces sp. 2A115 TaxID=3457439 RepID=UPI003FD2C9C0
MSLISRALAPAAAHDVAGMVVGLLQDPRRPGKRDLLARVKPDAGRPAPGAPRLPDRPTGMGTSAVRIPTPTRPSAPTPPSALTLPASPTPPTAATVSPGSPAPRLPGLLSGPTGLGTSASRALQEPSEPQKPASTPAPNPAAANGPVIYCPPAVRDDPALGTEVNERLVEWAEECGIYPGQLDRVRSCDFGRLIMLAHPDSDDPDVLLAAAKCALSEWSVDDHYVDGEVEEARHDLLGQRLAIAHSVIDQAHLPLRYAPELEEVVRKDPVAVALRSGLDNLAKYATTTQVRRLRHELAIMFVAYNQEAVWHTAEMTPPVWEFLMHRHENSFVPCIVLTDVVGGYELPAAEFADPRVRRALTMAGTASVVVNDLYSMGKEDPTDLSLPRVIAAEENCSLEEAVERTVLIHDELMHTYEAEAAALAAAGSPQLGRFLAGVWNWVGGSREWHASSARYNSN